MQFVQKLAMCDASLFEFIHANQRALEKYAPIERKNGIAYFKTSGDPKNNRITFKRPMMVNGVAFTGFYQEYTALPLGLHATKDNTIDVYYWGLHSTTRPAELAKRLPQLHLTAQSDGYWAGKTWIIDDVNQSTHWTINDNAVGGTAPVKGSAEKVLFVEEYQGKVALACTVQGYLTDEIIHAVRPDLQGL